MLFGHASKPVSCDDNNKFTVIPPVPVRVRELLALLEFILCIWMASF